MNGCNEEIYSTSQNGVYYSVDSWISVSKDLLSIDSLGVRINVPQVSQITDYYYASRQIGKQVELNLDVFLLHHDTLQDLLLVYPYGENLPEEESNTEVINIIVTKKWEDEDNRDNIRPDEITVNLYADNELCKTVSFSGTGNMWTYVFENLPVMKNSKVINYRTEEVVPEGYIMTQQNIY